MAVHIEDNKLAIITEHKNFHFNLHKYVSKNMKHEINSIIKHNKFLAEHTIKIIIIIIIIYYYYNISTETIFMNTENSKTIKAHCRKD